MRMEKEITEHLKELYRPVAMILHGSRAVGRERIHSDWDLFLLYKAETELPKNGRLIWHDQNIEHTHHHLPVEDLEKEFGVKMQFGRILYESESEGTNLLVEAKDYYTKPAGWSEKNNNDSKLWMKGRVDGMRDTVHDPLLFERYASDFYARITNYWYWAIHDTFPKPIYLALEEIKDKDPDYFNLIEKFVCRDDRNQRLAAAEAIMTRCFE